MCNTHGESNWCLGTYCLIIIGFITVIIMLESRNVSMCDVSESPQYSETDFYSSEPYRVYLRTKISTDCTLEFEEEDVYIEYKFRNKVLAQNVYNTFNTAFNTTTPTACITKKYTNDFTTSFNERLLDKMVC